MLQYAPPALQEEANNDCMLLVVVAVPFSCFCEMVSQPRPVGNINSSQMFL